MNAMTAILRFINCSELGTFMLHKSEIGNAFPKIRNVTYCIEYCCSFTSSGKINQHKFVLRYTLRYSVSTASPLRMIMEYFYPWKVPSEKRTQWNYEWKRQGWPTFTMLGAMLMSYLWMISAKFLCGTSISESVQHNGPLNLHKDL